MYIFSTFNISYPRPETLTTAIRGDGITILSEASRSCILSLRKLCDATRVVNKFQAKYWTTSGVYYPR